MQLTRRGILLVVSGPSGVGKGTLIRGVRAKYPSVGLSVSCTTRPPRDGETEGVDYFFVTTDQFATLRDAGELLEWAEVYPGLFYGTPRRPVEEALARGEDLILEIDDQGAQSVRATLGDRAVLVFVAPPSFAELHRRLADRGTESPAQLLSRLSTAREEIGNLGCYDYVIVNEVVDTATAALEGILLAEQALLADLDYRSFQASLLAEAEAVLQRLTAEVSTDG